MEIVAVVLVLSGAVLSLVVPLIRPPLIRLHSAAGPAAQLEALEERKAMIYGAIREVGFDLRTDKLDQADYEREVAALKREAIGVVSQIQEIKTTPPRGPKTVEAAISALRRGGAGAARPAAGDRFCTQCGEAAKADARFCAGCGTALTGTD